MLTSTLVRQIDGLDEQAASIVAERWSLLDRYFASHFPAGAPWYDALRIPASHQQDCLIQRALAQHVLGGELVDSHLSSAEQAHVRASLLPLAKELGFDERALRLLVKLCIGRGWLRKPKRNARDKQKPEVDDVLPIIRAIWRSASTEQERAAALNRAGICRNDGAAAEVVKELRQAHVDRYASSSVLALLRSFGEYGEVGLLHLSSHPLTEELFLIEQHRPVVSALSPDFDSVIAELRGDLYALYRGLYDEIKPLWQPDLLHAPPDIERRRRYRKELYPRLLKRIIAGICRARGSDEDSAQRLLEAFLKRGLAGMIALRTGQTEEVAQQAIERQRIMATLGEVTAGMPPDLRAECERIVFSLLRATVEAGFQFSFKPLLRERPSSPRRQRWGRRLWFGLPATMLRKRIRRRKWGPKVRSVIRRAHIGKGYGQRLITAFAREAVLDEREARGRLRDFLTYGLLGLLPRPARSRAVDPRLLAWLELIKLGRLDGSVGWSTMAQGLRTYCQALEIEIPAVQISRALYNSFPKPRYWHGGKGRAVDGYRQRATLRVNTRPRLHEIWAVLRIPLDLELALGQPRRYFLVLVIDLNSELPMGGWLSDTTPGSRELGLALYQAIFHVGCLHWPLHGLPERIIVPSELVHDGYDDLKRAATMLLARLEIVEKISLEGKPKAVALRDDYPREARAVIKPLGESELMPTPVALARLLHWLRDRCFPEHREAMVPERIRRWNVAMAGWGTPAAGYLLPMVGETKVDDVGDINLDGQRFAPKHVALAPGTAVKLRSFPFAYPKDRPNDPELGIFADDGKTIHYLYPS